MLLLMAGIACSMMGKREWRADSRAGSMKGRRVKGRKDGIADSKVGRIEGRAESITGKRDTRANSSYHGGQLWSHLDCERGRGHLFPVPGWKVSGGVSVGEGAARPGEA